MLLGQVSEHLSIISLDDLQSERRERPHLELLRYGVTNPDDVIYLLLQILFRFGHLQLPLHGLKHLGLRERVSLDGRGSGRPLGQIELVEF